MSEQTNTTPGTTTRRQRDEARDLIKRLRAENPTADRAEIVRLYMQEVTPLVEPSDEGQGWVLTPLREWVAAQIVEPRKQKSREQAAAERAPLIAEMEANHEKKIDEIITRRLLEWELIDGRVLGDLTGAECRNLSERYGVFFHVISDQMPPRARVRNRFTELELQALARHHKLIVP